MGLGISVGLVLHSENVAAFGRKILSNIAEFGFYWEG